MATSKLCFHFIITAMPNCTSDMNFIIYNVEEENDE